MKRIFLLAAAMPGPVIALESDFANTNLGWTLFLHFSETNPGDVEGFITDDEAPTAQGGFLNVPNLNFPDNFGTENEAVTWTAAPQTFAGSWVNSTSLEVALEVRTTSGETTRPVAFFLMDSTGNNSALFTFDALSTPSTPGVVTLTAPLDEMDWTVQGDWQALIADVSSFYIRTDLQRGVNSNEFLGIDRVERIDGPVVVESEAFDAVMVKFYAPPEVEVQLERSTNLDEWTFVESFFDQDEDITRCFRLDDDFPRHFFRTQAFPGSTGSGTLETLDLTFDLVELRDRTTIFRASLGGLTDSSEVTSLTLFDNNLQLGAAGVFTGFDLDFALIDADGDLGTTDDQGTGTFDSDFNFFNAGSKRTDADFPFDATTLHPGPLFGLDAQGLISPTVTTLGALDAAYDLPLTVDSSSGFLSLGDGGSISMDFPFSDIIFGSDPHLFIGEVGMTDGENLGATLEYLNFDLFVPAVETTLARAVEITFDASSDTTYQAQASTDGIIWTDLGEAFTSPGTLETVCYDLTGVTGRRFRIIEIDSAIMDQ